MTNKKSTKKALLMSALSLLLCMSMLVGTTFAWFTDSVESLNNKIVAGNLDVELYNALPGNLTDVTKVKDGGLFEEITYWEPGVVAYENLTIANEGTLALKYALRMNFDNENTLNDYGLSDKLQVAFVPGGIEDGQSREKVLEAANKVGFDPMDSFTQEGKLLPKENDHIEDSLKDGVPVGTVTYAIVIYWEPSDDDNNWNANNNQTTSDGKALHIDLGVNLFATQLVAEHDTFGPEYDENAKLPVFGTIVIPDNLTEETYEIPAGSNVVIDLNGMVINTANGFVNSGTAVVEGGTLVTEDIDGDIWYGAYTEQGADTTFNDVVIESNGGGANIYGTAEWNGGSITTNSDTSKPRHVFYVAGSDGKLDIHSGEFNFNPTNLTRKGSYLVAHGAGAVINVYGGTFGKPSTRTAPVQEIDGGEVNIYGGTFAWDPSAWVADGYKALYNGSNWVVVPASVDVIASDSEALKSALTEGKVNILLTSGTYTSNFSVPAGKEIVISGAGAETVLQGQIATTSSTEGKLTLKNLTINVDENIVDSTGISQTSKSAIAIWGNQTVICENVTFNMSLANSTAITSWWDTGKGTTIIVKDCTFNCNGQRPIRATGNVTVENCTFNDPYRYAVQLTAKASTATELAKAIINFKNNTIVNGENGKDYVYGIQLEGADYGCNNCVINGAGNTIVDGGAESAMYYCECGKVVHETITFNTEVEPVHEG